MQDDTISEDQLTSAASTASHESEQEIKAEPEQRTEAELEKEQIRELEITEPTVSRATSTTRSSDSGGGRRFYHSLTPRAPRTHKRKACPCLPTAVRNTGNRIFQKKQDKVLKMSSSKILSCNLHGPAASCILIPGILRRQPAHLG